MKKIVLIIFILAGIFTACDKDFLETAPTNQISDADIFSSVAGAQTVIDGIVRDMRNWTPGTSHDEYGVKSLEAAYGLAAEDLVIVVFHWMGWDYQLDNRAANYRRTTFAWRMYYRIVNNTNNIIVNIDDAVGDNVHKQNIKAMALTLRAFAYFNLVERFQSAYAVNPEAPGVPIYLEPTMEGGPRAPLSAVYQQINQDLDAAIGLFEQFPMNRIHISHPNVNVAHGIKARVAQAMGNHPMAATHAAAARQGVNLNTRSQFASGFDNHMMMSWIWGFEVNDEQSTIYRSWFAHFDMTIDGYAPFSPKVVFHRLYEKLADGDIRKELVDTAADFTVDGWINEDGVRDNRFKYANLKYSAAEGKMFAADYVMMRPEEMLLIEAEAAARGGNEGLAQQLVGQLRAVRFADGAGPAVTETGADLIEVILTERRIELWMEAGARFFDIRRLQLPLDRTSPAGQTVAVHQIANAFYLELPANANQFYYLVPLQEINSNPNIGPGDQNPI